MCWFYTVIFYWIDFTFILESGRYKSSTYCTCIDTWQSSDKTLIGFDIFVSLDWCLIVCKLVCRRLFVCLYCSSFTFFPKISFQSHKTKQSFRIALTAIGVYKDKLILFIINIKIDIKLLFVYASSESSDNTSFFLYDKYQMLLFSDHCLFNHTKKSSYIEFNYYAIGKNGKKCQKLFIYCK